MMKLFAANASPFARKVRIAAEELKLSSQIEIVDCKVTPVAPDEALSANNPLSKIPCLVTDEAGALFDSRVICAYLDTRSNAASLIGDDRLAAMRMEALADGMMDALVSARYETATRPDGYRWKDWVRNQMLKADRALDAVEGGQYRPADWPNIGAIALACSLGYLDFRFGIYDWRENRPWLTAWFAHIEQKPIMQATKPE